MQSHSSTPRWTEDNQRELEVLNNKIAACRTELRFYEAAFLSLETQKRKFEESQETVIHCPARTHAGAPRRERISANLDEIIKRYNLGRLFAQVAQSTGRV